MRKFITLFLLCFLITGCFAAESPYLQYYSDPYFEITPISDPEIWESLYARAAAITNLGALFHSHYYNVYEIVMVEIDGPHETIDWLFPSEFQTDQEVRLLFVTTDFKSCVICTGESQANGHILMSGMTLEKNTYYLFVLANNI